MIYTPEYYNENDFPVIRDVSDLPILVSAIIDNVDVLITGDSDFSAVLIDRLEIMTPSDFLEKYS